MNGEIGLGEVEEENKQAKLIGRIMIEDQGAIFLYVKHETSINPPNYIVPRFVILGGHS